LGHVVGEKNEQEFVASAFGERFMCVCVCVRLSAIFLNTLNNVLVILFFYISSFHHVSLLLSESQSPSAPFHRHV